MLILKLHVGIVLTRVPQYFEFLEVLHNNFPVNTEEALDHFAFSVVCFINKTGLLISCEAVFFLHCKNGPFKVVIIFKMTAVVRLLYYKKWFEVMQYRTFSSIHLAICNLSNQN